jgi:hypothetical protein
MVFFDESSVFPFHHVRVAWGFPPTDTHVRRWTLPSLIGVPTLYPEMTGFSGGSEIANFTYEVFFYRVRDQGPVVQKKLGNALTIFRS